MLTKQPPKLSLAQTEPPGEAIDVILIQSAVLNQGERARHRIRGAAPRAHIRRGLGTAAEARTQTRFLRRRRGRKEDNVFCKRRPGRANRTAIDPVVLTPVKKRPSKRASR